MDGFPRRGATRFGEEGAFRFAPEQRGQAGTRRIAVVVAHPDDETLGCGALLGGLEGPDLVLVTDGAPRDLVDARRYGFATAERYAAARTQEMSMALKAGGCRPAAVVELGYADQQAAFHLVPLARELAGLFESRGIRLVLTHAYEGGHPDHDATAFAVHAAARIACARGQSVSVVEMPFYGLGQDGMVRQEFMCDGPPVLHLALNREARRRKRRMIAAHATQRAILAPFHVKAELYREAPAYDFAALPNGGRLLYETFGWGLSGAEWLRLAPAALDSLRREDGL